MAAPDLCFLFNAQSDCGRSEKHEQTIRYQIQKRWPNSEFIVTEHDKAFWDAMEKRLSGVSIVVACGGDGTVHKAGNLAIKLNAILGVVPIGSGNDFAHMMNIPKSLTAALDLLHRQHLRTIDVLKIGGDVECFCLNTTGIGLDGMANHFTALHKIKWGKAAYVAGALSAVFASREFGCSLTIDGKLHDDQFLMITSCNGKREGGIFRVAPRADPGDGLIDLLAIRPMSKPALLLALPAFLLCGSEQFINNERHRCKRIEVRCNRPVYFHVDGEYSETKIQHLTLNILGSALQVIA